jgi:hypothetical protein
MYTHKNKKQQHECRKLQLLSCEPVLALNLFLERFEQLSVELKYYLCETKTFMYDLQFKYIHTLYKKDDYDR